MNVVFGTPPGMPDEPAFADGSTIYLDWDRIRAGGGLDNLVGQENRQLRRTFFHELGHILDFQTKDRHPMRRRYRAVMDDRRGWREESEDPNLGPPAEQFAEAYAAAAYGLRPGRRFQGNFNYGFRPTRHQMAKLQRKVF